MPQIDWTPEFKRSTTPEFDRLKLKVGEKARIVCMEKPSFAWVHTLRKPKITDGHASKVIKKRKDGTEYADWDMEFVGRPQCLGDYATIEAEGGIDATNCPICAQSRSGDIVAPPERRFAMNIIKYNTRADGTVITPFGCSCQVWSFTENVFNKLLSIATEAKGLVGRDLLLGPCQPPENYQKFDIQAGFTNAWEEDERITQLVRETYSNNKVEDLEAACGRKTEVRWMKDDLAKIADAWAVALNKRSNSGVSEKQEVASLKGELDNLIKAPEPVTRPSREGLAQEEKTFADRQAPLSDEEAKEVSGGSDPEDFSKLLQDVMKFN